MSSEKNARAKIGTNLSFPKLANFCKNSKTTKTSKKSDSADFDVSQDGITKSWAPKPK